VRIEASAHDPKVAYVALNAYRSGNDAPMIVRTADGGATWQSVVGEGIPNYAPVEVIREDPGNPRLLYVGTHFGLFASIDGGAKWMRLADVPAVRVDDLVIHPRTADLVIGTHGRSIGIVDDTRPLRELTPEVAASRRTCSASARSTGSTSSAGGKNGRAKASSAARTRRRARSSTCG
jgi:photosystem II stability/assembly factor-like uncharacterized protein